MANVERGVAVTGALNRFVRRVYDYKVGFEASGLAALKAVSRAIEAIVADINSPERNRADYTALIEHIKRLSDAVQTEPTMVPVPAKAAPKPVAPPPKAPVEPMAEVVSDEPEYDAEIAAIFTEESAELLEAAGVDTVKELRTRNAENLATKMGEVNAEKKLSRTSPTGSVVQGWIDAAKTIEPTLNMEVTF